MIKINSKNIKVGNELLCVKELSLFLTKGLSYEIVNISDKEIQIVDDDNDKETPLRLSLDKNSEVNIFRYFKIWDNEKKRTS